MKVLQNKPNKKQSAVTSMPDAVFTRLAEVFNCAAWEIRNAEKKFVAETTACKLCAIAKKINAPAPCHLYCPDPMEGMVKCRVLVNDNAG